MKIACVGGDCVFLFEEISQNNCGGVIMRAFIDLHKKPTLLSVLNTHMAETIRLENF